MKIHSVLPAAALAGVLSWPVCAQYVQQGNKLVGTGYSASMDAQGFAVALSADGNTAVLGGPDTGATGDINNINSNGEVWVFTRGNGSWTEQGPGLQGTGGVGNLEDQGIKVALSGDGNTLVVGAPFDDPGSDPEHPGSSVGAMWVFTRTNGTWSQQGDKLVPTGYAVPPSAGSSVAISSDGNTAVMGGPFSSTVQQRHVGAAWVFTRSNGVWSQQAELQAPGASDQGWWSALSGDGNTVLLGGLNGAWVFSSSNGIWTEQGTLKPSDGSGFTSFGQGTALSADGNTALVGGYEDNGYTGAAWVFTRSNGTWSQQGPKLVGAGASGAANQGTSVSLSADGNLALIGGPEDNKGVGAAWVFARVGGAWSQLGGKLVGTGYAAGGALEGTAVALSGDGSTALIGGPSDNGGLGAAWVFARAAATAPSAASVSFPATGSGTTGTFTFTFSDAGGWQNLTVVDVLVRDVLDGRQACYVAFVPSGVNSGSVYLVDNSGDAGGPYAGMVLPGNGSVSNAQCTITGAGSSVSGSGNMLTLTLGITFTPGFAGNKLLYMAAQDASGSSGWQPLGTWSVPGSPAAGPGVGGVTPASSSGFTQTYKFTFTDTNGFQDIAVANVLINGSIDGRHACYVALVPASATSVSVLLVDDAGDGGGPFSGMVVPGSGNVSNSQCSIAGAGSAVSAGGNTLTVTLPITFTQSFTGNQIVYAAARSNTASSGWQAVGTAAVR